MRGCAGTDPQCNELAKITNAAVIDDKMIFSIRGRIAHSVAAITSDGYTKHLENLALSRSQLDSFTKLLSQKNVELKNIRLYALHQYQTDVTPYQWDSGEKVIRRLVNDVQDRIGSVDESWVDDAKILFDRIRSAFSTCISTWMAGAVDKITGQWHVKLRLENGLDMEVRLGTMYSTKSEKTLDEYVRNELRTEFDENTRENMAEMLEILAQYKVCSTILALGVQKVELARNVAAYTERENILDLIEWDFSSADEWRPVTAEDIARVCMVCTCPVQVAEAIADDIKSVVTEVKDGVSVQKGAVRLDVEQLLRCISFTRSFNREVSAYLSALTRLEDIDDSMKVGDSLECDYFTGRFNVSFWWGLFTTLTLSVAYSVLKRRDLLDIGEEVSVWSALVALFILSTGRVFTPGWGPVVSMVGKMPVRYALRKHKRAKFESDVAELLRDGSFGRFVSGAGSSVVGSKAIGEVVTGRPLRLECVVAGGVVVGTAAGDTVFVSKENVTRVVRRERGLLIAADCAERVVTAGIEAEDWGMLVG